MTRNDEPNPYAAPVEASHAAGLELSDAPNEFARERRGVARCIVLTIFTLGIYQALWLYKRQPFIDQLDDSRKLGGSVPVLLISAHLLNLALALGGPSVVPLRSLISLIGAVGTIAACFKIKAILTSTFTRTGRRLDVSGLGTFFFGIYYLQYKLNRASETPARVKKRKRRKKRRQAEATTAPTL